MVTFLTIAFIFVCILLILFILAQKPKGGGLSGAFGGAGGGGAVFGSKAGDALTWMTVAGFVCFLLIAIGLVYATRDDAEEPVEAVGPGIEVEGGQPQPEDATTPPPGTPDPDTTLDPGDFGFPTEDETDAADDGEEASPSLPEAQPAPDADADGVEPEPAEQP